MNDELAMLLKTVIPLAAVSLALLVLYSYLPLWMFVVVLVATAGVAASPKARTAIKNALAPPADPQSGNAATDNTEKK